MNANLRVLCLLFGISASCRVPSAAGILHASSPIQVSAQRLRLMQARKQAMQVRTGTSRAAIEKLYPHHDAGLNSYDLSRYYLGNGIMVDVPFDEYGGAGGKQNRVNGPLRVYLSPPHFN